MSLVHFLYQIIPFIKSLVKGKKIFCFIKYDENDGGFCANRMGIWKLEVAVFVDMDSKKIGILEKPVQNRQKQQDIYCFELMRAIFVLFLAGRKDKI